MAEKLLRGSINEVILRVGNVSGFYSNWSPSISTGSIKVLTSGDEQAVKAPPGVRVPRLGQIGEGTLSINRIVEFETAPAVRDRHINNEPPSHLIPPPAAPAGAMGPDVLATLITIKQSLWWIGLLLALILGNLILRR